MKQQISLANAATKDNLNGIDATGVVLRDTDNLLVVGNTDVMPIVPEANFSSSMAYSAAL